jgi:hypothetical protein
VAEPNVVTFTITVTPQQEDFVAPVELIGFPRSNAQRYVGSRRRVSTIIGPSPDVAAYSIVAAVIAAPT